MAMMSCFKLNILLAIDLSFMIKLVILLGNFHIFPERLLFILFFHHHPQQILSHHNIFLDNCFEHVILIFYLIYQWITIVEIMKLIIDWIMIIGMIVFRKVWIYYFCNSMDELWLNDIGFFVVLFNEVLVCDILFLEYLFLFVNL
jgi:hypothetical protein